MPPAVYILWAELFPSSVPNAILQHEINTTMFFFFLLFCFVLSFFLTGNEILRGGDEFGFSLLATDPLARDGPCMLLSTESDVN